MENKLTFSQTDNLKGLLILLIIFGHIQLFFSEHEFLQMVLYSFHVSSFLMLPFLFNHDKLSIKNIKKNLRRIYVPYSIFFLLSVVAYSFITKEFDFFATLLAWFIGTANLIKPQAGFSLLWFFPALFSTIIFILIYNTLSMKKKKIMLLFFFITHLLLSLLSKEILIYLPFSLYVPLYLFSIGMVIHYIYHHTNYSKYSTWLISTIFIALLYGVYGSYFNLSTATFPNIIDKPIEVILHDLTMIVGFFTMIAWSRDMKFFQVFGKYSLAIFTLHPFVIQLLDKLYRGTTMMDAVIKFIVVVMVSYVLAKIIDYFNFNKIIYPR